MTSSAQYRTSQWKPVELEFSGPSVGNPFIDVDLRMDVTLDGHTLRVPGFYDGDGCYRIRFTPDRPGLWTYSIVSNAMEPTSGTIDVSPAASGDRGPVMASSPTHFAYADGTEYHPFGTTVYALPHQPAELVRQTLETLAKGPFNKVRLCVFPKDFKYNTNEPDLLPFESLGVVSEGETGARRFDFSRFNPTYFRHLEGIVARLGSSGIEADIILFHPYDRWGFAEMSAAEDEHYLRYVVARLASFPNVWWSMANEFDLLKTKSDQDWNKLLEIVEEADPYGHLRSVHNCFRYFDQSHPLVTHVSVQRDQTAQTVISMQKYGKPVIVDECGYEGDLSDAWGNLSGVEMMHRVWEAVTNGGYATHGETFRNAEDVVFWSKGGKLEGESVSRIAFLRKVLDEAGQGLEPLPSVRRLILQAGGPENLVLSELHAAGTDLNADPEHRVVIPWFFTIGRPGDIYLSYFGVNQPGEVIAAVPHGEVYEAHLIDTWEMSTTKIADHVIRGQIVQFANKPYQALLLRRRE